MDRRSRWTFSRWEDKVGREKDRWCVVAGELAKGDGDVAVVPRIEGRR